MAFLEQVQSEICDLGKLKEYDPGSLRKSVAVPPKVSHIGIRISHSRA